MGRCSDCRFYDGKRCSIDGNHHTASYSCWKFSSNIKSSAKRCSDCRFYDGKRCSIDGNHHTASYSCWKFSPYR